MATKLLSNIFITTLIVNLVSSDDSHRHPWSYSAQNNWDKLCLTGVKQSPIDIETKRVTLNTSLSIDFKNYDKDIKNFDITNNGHSAQLAIDYSNDVDKNSHRPFITGLALDNQVYEFEQLHFHWSTHKGRGSEHAIDGKRYSMEMHLVHYNKRYGNISEAVHHSDGLSVVGVLFQITRKENPFLDGIIEGVEFTKIQGTGDFISREINSENRKAPTINLQDLLPNDVDTFFRYKGSLTTPPCAESVNWLVFSDTTDIGLKQIQKFRDLMDKNKIPMSDTFRSLQSTHDRKIELSQKLKLGLYGTGLASNLNSNIAIIQMSLIASFLTLVKY